MMGVLRRAKSPFQQLLSLGGWGAGDVAGGCGHTFITGTHEVLKKIVFIQIEFKLS